MSVSGVRPIHVYYRRVMVMIFKTFEVSHTPFTCNYHFSINMNNVFDTLATLAYRMLNLNEP